MSSIASTRLPPEILDAILVALVDVAQPHHPSPSYSSTPQQAKCSYLSTASLISKAWQAPAQRRLFEHVVVRSAGEVTRATQGVDSFDLGELVRALQVQSSYADIMSLITKGSAWGDTPVAAHGLAQLLGRLPRLVELDLRWVGFTHLPESSISLGNLRVLRISTAPFDTSHALLRSLLRLSPNLESLELSYWANRSHPSHGSTTPNSPCLPSSLPHLRKLVLGLNFGAVASVLPTLLDPSTLLRIATLHFLYSQTGRGIDTILKALPNVVVAVHDAAPENALVEALYSHLPLLEEASYYREDPGNQNDLPLVPSTVHTLKFANSAKALEGFTHLARGRWPSGLRRLKVENRGNDSIEDTAKVRQLEALCAQKGVKLVVVDRGRRNI